MMPYDKAKKECAYGEFDLSHHAAYTLKEGDKLKAPWYYIYNNRKVLLYVDQNGPVKVQYQPPSGILVIKRELGENQSKWQVWVQSPDLNDGVPVSNFNSPSLRYDLKKPEFSVNWTPEKAIYTAKYDNAEIVTEIFVPCDKATVCMKTKVINTSGKDMDFTVTPSLFPYVNIPQMVAWDLPEWYLASKIMKKGKMLTIHGQMNDPHMNKADFRSVTFNMDFEDDAEVELDFSRYSGAGNFFSPDAVKFENAMGYKMPEADGAGFATFQSVWAARYKFSLKPGESKALTQVLTIQEDVVYNDKENEFEAVYFDEKTYAQRVKETEKFYSDMFTKRTIKTSNELYNNFINTFVPLQMYWVGSLDRGWPSSMRGTRDASQDFIGVTPLNPEWTKETLRELFEHQQLDGWMPRQISTISRTAPHDMRYFCDGGAFLLELINEYMKFTRDTEFLKEELVWLESDEKSTVLEHIVRTMAYYINPKNIGEHHLCKVWNGDWWDIMDKIGLEGRGETVTVTAQTIINLENLAEMFKWLYEIGEVDESYLKLADEYMAIRDKFIEGMVKYAYNKDGYFNGYLNDNGKWLLCEKDPDGEKRVYLVANAWALIAGFSNEEMRKSVVDNVDKYCFGKVGFDAYNKGYPNYVDKAGRVGNGTIPGTTMYNHAQSFFTRACCLAGDSERAYKVTRYILPIENDYHPVEKTLAPPYALTNKYSNSDKNLHRASFQFLSGTTSYCLRIVYNFFFGITYDYKGLYLKPCIPAEFGDCSVEFEYTGKKFTVNYKKTDSEAKKVTLNGKTFDTVLNERSGKQMAFFEDAQLEAVNTIEMEY